VACCACVWCLQLLPAAALHPNGLLIKCAETGPAFPHTLRPDSPCSFKNNRSCRERLLLHNSRRKQRVEARTDSLSDLEEEAGRSAAASAPSPAGAVPPSTNAAVPRSPAKCVQARASPAAGRPAQISGLRGGGSGAAAPGAMAPPPRRARSSKGCASGATSNHASEVHICTDSLRMLHDLAFLFVCFFAYDVLHFFV